MAISVSERAGGEQELLDTLRHALSSQLRVAMPGIIRKRRIQTVLTFRQREARPSMAADRGPGSPASPVYDR